jgi:hypothetical protein
MKITEIAETLKIEDIDLIVCGGVLDKPKKSGYTLYAFDKYNYHNH